MRAVYLRSALVVGLIAGLGGFVAHFTRAESTADIEAARLWKAHKKFIRDEHGRAVILRGVNISQKQKHPPFLDFQEEPDYARIHDDWGMNVIRFIMPWAALEPRKGKWDQEYLTKLKHRLDWAHDHGIRVVLDMHQDVFGEGFHFGGDEDGRGGSDGDGAPLWACNERNYADFRSMDPIDPWFFNVLRPSVMDCLIRLWAPNSKVMDHMIHSWAVVAQRLGDHPAVIGFDPLNEPFHVNIANFDSTRLSRYYNLVVKRIRQYAPHWIAFVEPSSTRNMGIAPNLELDFDNIVYAPHSYDVNAETGAGFLLDHEPALRHHVEELQGDADKLNAPLWIGEYGGMADRPNIFEYMNTQNEAAGMHAAGNSYWNYTRDNWYGILVRKGHEKPGPQGDEKPELMRALIRVYPTRVAGDPVNWLYSPESEGFIFKYRPDRSIKAPTEISIAPRLYKDGYEVICDGCKWTSEPDKGRLLITEPAEGETGRVVLRTAKKVKGPSWLDRVRQRLGVEPSLNFLKEAEDRSTGQ